MSKKEYQNKTIGIIRQFFKGKGNFPKELVGKFQYWLSLEDKAEEKSEELETVFNEIVNYDQNPNKDSYRMLGNFLKKTGMKDHLIWKRRKLVFRRRMIGVAAVLAALVMVGGIALFILNDPSEQPTQVASVEITVSSKEDEHSRMVLADSSLLLISPGSRVAYAEDYATADTRNVKISGEVYFEVESDVSRPFIVETDFLNVTVLGTKFNVESRPEKAQTVVTLYSGRVKIDGISKDTTTEIMLEPGMEVIVDNVTGQYNIVETQSQLPGWITDRLTFERSSLDHIFSAIEWYYDVKVEKMGEFKANTYSFRLTGTESLETAMMMIEEITLGFTHTIDGKSVKVNGTK